MRKVWLFVLTMLLVFSWLLSGCGASSANKAASDSGNMLADKNGSLSNQKQAMSQAEQDVVAYDQAVPAFSGAVPAYAAVPENYDRKIIKNADLTVTITGVQAYTAELEKDIEALGGFIASSSQSKYKNDKLRVEMTLRLPAGKFAGFIARLEEKGSVENKRIYTEDVTEEYIDLEARIKNLTVQEQRLQAILAKAATVDEMLKIERELERVRGEIDSLTGKLNYLKNKTSLSTINLTLLEKGLEQKDISAGSLSGTWGNGVAALTASVNALLSGLGSLIILAFGLLPFLLMLGIIGVVYITVKRCFKTKKDQNV